MVQGLARADPWLLVNVWVCDGDDDGEARLVKHEERRR